MAELFSPQWQIYKAWSEAPENASLNEYIASCRKEVIEYFTGSYGEAMHRIAEIKKSLFGIDWRNENNPVKISLKLIAVNLTAGKAIK